MIIFFCSSLFPTLDFSPTFFFFFFHLFWLHRVFAVACGTYVAARGLLVAARGLLVAACVWDLVPRPEIEPGPPALGAQSLTHQTTREVPPQSFLNIVFFQFY